MNNNNAYKLRIPLLPKTTEETAVSPKHLTQPIGSTGFLALILKYDWHWICVQNTVRQDTGTSSNGNYWITGWSSSCPSSRLLGIVPQAQWRDVWEAAECAGWVHSPHGLLLGELEATRVNEPSRPICVPQGFAHQVGSRKAQAHNLQECRLPDHSLVCHSTPLGNVPTYLHPIQQTHSLVRCWITTQANKQTELCCSWLIKTSGKTWPNKDSEMWDLWVLTLEITTQFQIIPCSETCLTVTPSWQTEQLIPQLAPQQDGFRE